MKKMQNTPNIIRATDILTPTFSIIGTVLATDVLQVVFLVLTIVSLSISLLSRLIKWVSNVYYKTKQAKEDGKLTKEELDEIMGEVVSGYHDFMSAEELKELTTIINDNINKKKGEK